MERYNHQYTLHWESISGKKDSQEPGACVHLINNHKNLKLDQRASYYSLLRCHYKKIDLLTQNVGCHFVW